MTTDPCPNCDIPSKLHGRECFVPLPESRCTFDVAWVGRCKDMAGPSGYCEKHAGQKCCSCGKQATRECDHTGIQFVCGYPLCDDCTHGTPKPGEYGMFNLGGGHHPRTATTDTTNPAD